MESSNFYYPAYVPLMSGVDSVPPTLMQSSDDNLKWEDGEATRLQPPDQQLQPTPPPSASSPPFRPQQLQSNILQRVWPEIQPHAHLQLQDTQGMEPSQTVTKSSSVLTLACLNCRAKKIKVWCKIMLRIFDYYSQFLLGMTGKSLLTEFSYVVPTRRWRLQEMQKAGNTMPGA